MPISVHLLITDCCDTTYCLDATQEDCEFCRQVLADCKRAVLALVLSCDIRCAQDRDSSRQFQTRPPSLESRDNPKVMSRSNGSKVNGHLVTTTSSDTNTSKRKRSPSATENASHTDLNATTSLKSGSDDPSRVQNTIQDLWTILRRYDNTRAMC